VSIVSSQRLSAVLLFLGLACCLPVFAETDSRVLYLELSGKFIELGMQDLQAIGMTEVEVPHDLVFPGVMRYRAVSLNKLLDHFGVPHHGQMMLICSDGYQLPLDLSLLDSANYKPYLAVSDISPEAKGNWQPYKHGREWISLDPFYLVWSGSGKDYLQRFKQLPWPYQLTGMKLVQKDEYRNTRPADNASSDIKQGHQLFVQHCIKCHAVKGAGGKLGPDLNRANGLAKLADVQTLRQFILHVDQYYPATAMPVFARILSSQQADQIMKYLKWL